MVTFFFTASSALAFALEHGLEFTVPTKTSSDFWSPIYLKHLQNPNYDPKFPSVTIRERQFHYQPIPFNESWRDKNIVLSGYFQSARYFDEYRHELLEAFALPYKMKEDTCSIHARYGDYLTIIGKHIIINETYLRRAINIIEEKTGIVKFKVFSDNIELFKERHGGMRNFLYSTNTNELDDLLEISNCAHNINSSSTFSWWGAYLNKNPDKIIVTDKQWFQPGWDNADTKDILMPEWIKI